MKTLQLADNLKLPADEAVTQKYGFIGRSGSGKSYAAMRLAELFLGAGAQIIALDWVGIWWSLRLAAGGKAPGFEHVYIFGGEHADVPLEPTSGALMADLVVDKHISVVLDVMHFRKAERTRFATAFAEQFFHRKKTARTACHLFIEEAQAYLPQMVRGEEARMVGVFEDIGKVGRNYGIGNSLISQRPQAINKDVLNQVEVLLAFQTNGPQERKAIAGWTAENTDAGAAMMQELPKLRVGDALVWSPQWLRVAERVHISERCTYDASSTPTQNAKAITPRTLAKADLEALGTEIKATIEKAKADDPRELRKQIAGLKKELSSTKITLAPDVKPTGKPALTDADRELLARLAEAVRKRTEDLQALTSHFQKDIEIAVNKAINNLMMLGAKNGEELGELFERKGLQKILAKLEGVATPAQVAPGPGGMAIGVRPSRVTTPPKPRQLEGGTPADGVSGPQQRILNALAWGEALGLGALDKTQLALLADASPTSSSYTNNLGTLRTSGLIDYPERGRVGLTPNGMASAVIDSVPRTSNELQAALIAKLSGPQGRILRELIAVYPSALSKEDLATRAEASATSSSYTNNLGTLRSLGVIDYPQRGMVVAKPVLFLKGAA